MKVNKHFFPVFLLLFVAKFFVLPSAIQADTESKSFSVKQGGSLEVSVDVGAIRIATWDKNEVFVRAEGIDKEHDLLRMTQSGNSVRVKYRSDGYGKKRVSFEIDVPSHFNLDLDTSGGPIDVRGELTGNLIGSTSGGHIEIDDVNGKVEMNTSGGKISAGRIQGDASFETSGGSIRIDSTTGELDVSTSGGSITTGDVGKSLKATTAGGGITIGDVGGDADVSTAGGSIEVGIVTGEASLNTAGGGIELLGANGEITAKTAGGGITLENISGSVEAKTAGGGITVELTPSGKGDSRLTTAGGDVILFVPESAKASIDACIRIRGSGWWNRDRRRGHREEYDIYSDFEAKTYDKDKDGGEICGTYELNGGGQNISLDTVNSDIEIRKMR